jgi:hypothetical protein
VNFKFFIEIGNYSLLIRGPNYLDVCLDEHRPATLVISRNGLRWLAFGGDFEKSPYHAYHYK